jgi:multiple sugar transport system permease protein
MSVVTTRRSARGALDQRQGITAALFLFPAMLGFGIFYLRPAVLGFYSSFTNKELLRPTSKWVGFDNYRKLVDDDVFKNALWVTLKSHICSTGSVSHRCCVRSCCRPG